MVAGYGLLMLIARGVPALLLYRRDLSRDQRIALALHSGMQLSLVVAITSIAVGHGEMPGDQGAALVGGGILTLLLFPALARRFLPDRSLSAARVGVQAHGDVGPPGRPRQSGKTIEMAVKRTPRLGSSE